MGDPHEVDTLWKLTVKVGGAANEETTVEEEKRSTRPPQWDQNKKKKFGGMAPPFPQKDAGFLQPIWNTCEEGGEKNPRGENPSGEQGRPGRRNEDEKKSHWHGLLISVTKKKGGRGDDKW